MNPVAFRLALAQAASGAISGASLPFFGAWLAWKGLSPAEIGAILSSGMLLRVLVMPVTGIYADARNDRRGTMLLLCLVLTAGYAALNRVSLPLLIFLAAVPASVCAGAATPLLESVSMRFSHRFGFDYGHVRLFASSAFVAANMLSGVLVSIFGLVIVAPWLFGAGVLNTAAVYALPAPPPDRARPELGPRMRATLAEARELMGSRVFLIFLVATSLDQGSHALYYGYGGLHWLALGYPGWLVSVLWPLGVLAEIAFMMFSLRIFHSVGAVRLIMLGAFSCMLRWSILAFDPPLPLVIFAQVLHGGTFALAHLGAMYFILKAVPQRLAATAQSLYGVCSSGLALGLATYASGPLYATEGGRAYLLMAAMGAGALVFALWLQSAWTRDRITAEGPEKDLATI